MVELIATVVIFNIAAVAFFIARYYRNTEES